MMVWIGFLIAVFFFVKYLNKTKSRDSRKRKNDYFKRKF
jgi:hypothetical protein